MSVEDAAGSMKPEIIKSVQNIIKIKSVKEQTACGMPFGKGINDALVYALDTASSLGFRTVNLDGYIGYAEYGQGDEIIGVLGHVDTVAEGKGWMFSPYEGKIYDNKIYGRGAIDDKGPTVAALYGLKSVKDSGLEIKKKVRIIFGTDEESGWQDIDYYLKNDIAPVEGFTVDGMFPVINAEKGSIYIELKRDISRKSKGMISIKSIIGGNSINSVPDLCTCELRLKDMAKLMLKDTLELYCEKNGINMSMEEIDDLHVITSRGISSHSSTPWKGKNAISQFISFISQFNLGQNDVSDFIKFLASYVCSGSDGADFDIDCGDDILGKLSLSLDCISIDDEKARAVINIRYPVTADYEEIMDKIRKIADDKKIDVSVLNHKRALYVKKESRIVSVLMDSYKSVTQKDPYTLSINGQTYAKAFDNMVAFGPVFPDKDNCSHMPNECIGIDDLIECTKIYARAIYELAK
ncbi:MAG TPA: dipeptidase PepV [Clostridiaceae bacterium]|nr:dipeptidase PepV [Clostridiaceae bacterium]